MKTLFIEAKYKKKIKLSKTIIDKLPKNIGLIASIQFLDSLKQIKKQLKKAVIGGQILGCDVKAAEKLKSKVDAFLYIGDGNFHALAVAVKTKKPVYKFNPFSAVLSKVEKQDIETYLKRKKAAMLKFLNGKNIGVIISTKPGQRYKKELNIEKKYPKKRFYTFIADNIDVNQFENFGFIDAWVNTACPRLEEDTILLNIRDLTSNL